MLELHTAACRLSRRPPSPSVMPALPSSIHLLVIKSSCSCEQLSEPEGWWEPPPPAGRVFNWRPLTNAKSRNKAWQTTAFRTSEFSSGLSHCFDFTVNAATHTACSLRWSWARVQNHLDPEATCGAVERMNRYTNGTCSNNQQDNFFSLIFNLQNLDVS